MTRLRPARRGATILEFAVVAPITFLLILGLIVAGMGVFRYQEVAHLAREGSRYASTRAGDYTLDGIAEQTGVGGILTHSDMHAYLSTRAVGVRPEDTTVIVSFSAPNSVKPSNLPTYLDTTPDQVPPAQKVHQNYVTVTVEYRWVPETFFTGPIKLRSTSTVPISY